MLSKKGYLLHFARIFFAGLLLITCSFLSHLWNAYQPFQLTLELQRCQSSLSSINKSHINIWKWLNDFQLIDFLPSLSFLSTSISSKCHVHLKDNYPLKITQYIGCIRLLLLIYLVYHLICLAIVHAQIKQLEEKQYHYARLYRQDVQHRKSRCSNRLLRT